MGALEGGSSLRASGQRRSSSRSNRVTRVSNCTEGGRQGRREEQSNTASDIVACNGGGSAHADIARHQITHPGITGVSNCTIELVLSDISLRSNRGEYS